MCCFYTNSVTLACDILFVFALLFACNRRNRSEYSHHFLEALVNGPLLITCQAGPCLCLRPLPGQCAGEVPADFPQRRLPVHVSSAAGPEGQRLPGRPSIPPKPCVCLFVYLFVYCPVSVPQPCPYPVWCKCLCALQSPALPSTAHCSGGGKANRAREASTGRQQREARQPLSQRPGCPLPGDGPATPPGPPAGIPG